MDRRFQNELFEVVPYVVIIVFAVFAIMFCVCCYALYMIGKQRGRRRHRRAPRIMVHHQPYVEVDPEAGGYPQLGAYIARMTGRSSSGSAGGRHAYLSGPPGYAQVSSPRRTRGQSEASSPRPASCQSGPTRGPYGSYSSTVDGQVIRIWENEAPPPSYEEAKDMPSPTFSNNK